MSFDLAALRAETPACGRVIHLNNAGASPSPQRVLDAITGQLARESAMGPMEAADATRESAERAYTSAARLLGCGIDEVAILGSQSAAFQTAFGGVRLSAGDRIIVTPSEWGGNYVNFERAAAATGATLEVAPVDADGVLDMAALAAMLDGRVKLVALSWVPANGGLMHPAAEVGRLLAGSGILYFLDAAQAVGNRPVDVGAIGCDVLTTSGRKWLRGPRGTALLHVRRSALDRLAPPLVDVFSAPWSAKGGYGMRGDARRHECSERSLALQLGLGTAIDLALELGLDAIRERTSALAGRLRAGLAAIPGVTLRDLGGAERAPLVSFTVAGLGVAEVRQRLAAAGIAAGANGIGYTPLDMAARGLDGIVRLAPHYFNLDEEIDAALAAVADIARSG
ncbi:MAG: aminotransferase class V-fold PLP-dependent enzyme [Alphaproteobacteria bacterium]|nr:aminotransferase class V-fold PLP-dependent enzyme [Alphaproteobacteria bacterium]